MTAKNLHQKASFYMQGAFAYQIRPNHQQEAQEYYRLAYSFQKEAAMQYLHKKHLEPTRSILFVSAANLAISCGLLAEAQMLAKYGLSCKRGLLSNRNPQIKELKMIFKRCKFITNHATKGKRWTSSKNPTIANS